MHAEIIDQILSGEFLTRPDWAPGAEIAVAILLTLILLAAVLSFGPILGAVGGADHHRDRGRDLVVRLRQRPSGARSDPAEHLRAQRLHRRDRPAPAPDRPRDANSCGAPSRNISRRRWSSGLAEDPAALTLGGETREITILFSDIRGFTSLSEKMDPQEITGLLNRFLTPMTDVLLESGATIDKYIGDAIMCFWNAPLTTTGSSAPRLPRGARHAEGAGGAEQARGR